MKKSEFDKDKIDLIITDFLTGKITATELAHLEEWINSDQENREYFNSLKDSWIVAGAKRKNILIQPETTWNQLAQRISDNQSKLVLGSGGQEKARWKRYLALAASWLLVFGIGSVVTWLIIGKSNKIDPIADNGGKLIEITVPLGAKSMIKMPDNTHIWLNAGTTITYGMDYGEKTRTLNLTGEAYFEVAKDDQHSFIVNTQEVVVRALGTRFNVKAYPDEKTISTTLEEGKIDVRIIGIKENDDRVLLKPKDKFIYHKETKSTEHYTESAEEKVNPRGSVPAKLKNSNIISNVRTELYTSWKDPRWIIDREPLGTLAPMLERRFNLKIIFDDEQLKTYNFTGSIENESVVQILNALKLTAPLDYQMKKDTIILTLDRRSKDEFKRIMTHN